VELEEAHREAEIAGEAKQHFLAGASHELHTPLNAIAGLAPRAQVDAMAHESRQGSITDNRNSGAHLLVLTDDTSKLEAHHLPLDEKGSLCARPRCAWRRRRRAVSRSPGRSR
jgi:signal transduction histidine kinase